MLWKKEPCGLSDTKPDEGAGKGWWENRREARLYELMWFLRAYSVPGTGETKRISKGLALGKTAVKICPTCAVSFWQFLFPAPSSTHFPILVTGLLFSHRLHHSLKQSCLFIWLLVNCFSPPLEGELHESLFYTIHNP